MGGLVASAAFALYTFAHGVAASREVLYFHPRTLSAAGLLMVLSSGLPAFFFNEPFLTAYWSKINIPVLGKVGTPLLFDTGVYLVVIGVTLMFIFSLEED